MQSRREFMQAALAGVVLVRQAPEPIVATRLADRCVLLTGAGSNVLMVTGPDGVVLVDGGAPQRSSELLAAVNAHSNGARVQALFNTHWHLDHTGSNDALAKGGAAIVAHENTKLWMGAEIISKWE